MFTYFKNREANESIYVGAKRKRWILLHLYVSDSCFLSSEKKESRIKQGYMEKGILVVFAMVLQIYKRR